MDGPRVVVLGGCGGVGELTVRRLAAGRRFAEIVIADSNATKAESLAEELGRGTVRVAVMDASDPRAVLRTMRGAQVVVNEVGPFFRFGTQLIEAALDAGVHYVDINDDADVTWEIFESRSLDRHAREAGLSVLIGMGTSPGVTNMLARLGADQMDRARAVEVRLITGAASRGAAVFAHRLHVFGGEATIYRDGAWAKVPAFGDPETISFPVPPGTGECYTVSHPEPITIPRFIAGVQHVSIKLGYLPQRINEAMRHALALGLGSAKPIALDGQAVSPPAFAAAYLASDDADHLFGFSAVEPFFGREVRVAGERAGRQTRIVYRYGGRRGGRITAMMPALAAELLVRGEIAQRGVLAPEALDPRPFLREMLAMGDVTCLALREEATALAEL